MVTYFVIMFAAMLFVVGMVAIGAAVIGHNNEFEKEQQEFAEMRLRMLETEAQRKAEKLAIHRTEQAWEGYQEAQRAIELMEELEGNHNDR